VELIWEVDANGFAMMQESTSKILLRKNVVIAFFIIGVVGISMVKLVFRNIGHVFYRTNLINAAITEAGMVLAWVNEI